jgi:1-deoxy-D-xylulose-5-phosphate synthase
MIILAPADEAECRAMLSAAYHHPGPAAVRYPRGTGPGVAVPDHLEPIPIGRAERRRESRVGVSDGEVNGGPRIALLAFGNVNTAVAEVAEALDATHLNMRSVKPLDRDAILHAADDHELLVTLEENVIAGGAGSAVGEFLAAAGVQVEMLHLGLPDAFVEHGTPAQLLADCGLDAAGIERAIRRRLATD